MTYPRIYFIPMAGEALAAADLGRAVDLTDHFIMGPTSVPFDCYSDAPPTPARPARPTFSAAAARRQYEQRGIIPPPAQRTTPPSIDELFFTIWQENR